MVYTRDVRNETTTLRVLYLALALAATGCGKSDDETAKKPPANDDKPAADRAPARKPKPARPLPPKMMKRTAMLEAKSGSEVSGKVFFEARDGKVMITADVSGLEPGDHGFHIHEKGDCSSDDGNSAGGHFNPEGVDHGAPDAEAHHAGDLGNLTAGEDGKVRVVRTVDLISVLEGEPHSIKGRAVVIHAKPDDLKTQPTGAAGARVACGVIE